jgi:hypothetical protein
METPSNPSSRTKYCLRENWVLLRDGWRKVAQRLRPPIIIRLAVVVKMKGFAHLAAGVLQRARRLQNNACALS